MTSPHCRTPWRLVNGALPADELLACLRSEVLHGWQPPGGEPDGALTHCVIHQLDIVEAVPLARLVPEDRVGGVLGILTEPGAPNVFGTDLSGVELRADDLDWSYGSGEVVSGPAQVLALVVCGRTVPASGCAGTQRGASVADAEAERLGQLAGQQSQRTPAQGGLLDQHGPAGEAREHGALVGSGNRAHPASTSQAVRTTPILAPWRPSTSWCRRWYAGLTKR